MTTLAEAVATVSAGDTVWLGNFGTQLFAVGAELVRQEARGLHVVLASGGLLLDRLIGAGVVSEVTFAHCWNAVGPAPTRHFRRAWQDGVDIRWHELPMGVLAAALGAAAQGVPFAPVRVHPGTGYATGDWSGGMLATVSTPFGAATVVKALPVDIAFVHVDRADAVGNSVFSAPPGEAVVAAQAARRVVVVAEEPGLPAGVRADLPGLLVDTVVVSPGAAAPDGVPGRYPRDVAAYTGRDA
ncbi:CoA-transferase [Actinophytocola algeriensis]|uniref:Glutaconate CoA-transferase subunit A n=1 Tax=Actinophytocola algeriensis TaxID=1768010 RepID=A0A7W7QCS1_9PSEU|nr:CoA-transferase [Actinophytocola algeriensis]MBB4910894.1 glutaconate CoA-transferase subunit A [Actinophytocola algeriensis]MBE1473887.1 glutaconate CoA-transferase subunit A [Actinophytocola algeriensis]